MTVTERGSIDSLKNATLTSKVEGTTSIIFIVPEGSHVKEGDLVCELDASALIDKETQQRIKVTQADAALRQADEEVQIQTAQNQSDISAAELAFDLAEIDLKKFELGDYKQQRLELEAAVDVSDENLSRAKEYLNYLERLVKKGYKMQSDLDAERIAFSKSENDKEVAEMKLLVLMEYTHERTMKELTANVKEFGLQIDRAKSKAAAALAQKKADLKAKTLTFEVESNLLKRLQLQIAECKIYAPQPGQVVYVNSRDGRGSDQVLVEEGAIVRERQQIINLPDLESMKVNARIHESRIALVHEGLQAEIKVDAAPTETFHGEVDNVSSVPSSINRYNPDLKEYEAVVRLTDDAKKVSQLRPGLNATLEILVSERENVLQIPVQSLISVLDQRFVYVLGPGGPVMREIEIGETNERTVEILSGLTEGERVVMNPRTQFGKQIGELEVKLNKEKAAEALASPGKTDSPPAAKKASPKGPPREGRPGGGPNGPGNGPPRGSPGESGGGRPRMDPAAFFQRMDQNQDGKLTADEMSERMRPNFDAIDSNKDGGVDQQEFTTFSSQFRQRGGGGAPVGGSD